MKNDVDFYVKRYIELCSKLCKNPGDYLTKNIRSHNNAVKKLERLRSEIAEDMQIATSVYAILLEDPDPYIRQVAASTCLLKLKIFTDQSVAILEWLCEHGNSMASVSSERTLLIWQGKLRPDQA